MNNTEIIYDGKIWHLWSALYLYNGSTYSIDFYAECEEDAKARIEAMRNSLTDGHQIIDQVDASEVGDDFDADEYMNGLKDED